MMKDRSMVARFCCSPFVPFFMSMMMPMGKLLRVWAAAGEAA
jgi:hypothetical protein